MSRKGEKGVWTSKFWKRWRNDGEEDASYYRVIIEIYRDYSLFRSRFDDIRH